VVFVGGSFWGWFFGLSGFVSWCCAVGVLVGWFSYFCGWVLVVVCWWCVWFFFVFCVWFLLFFWCFGVGVGLCFVFFVWFLVLVLVVGFFCFWVFFFGWLGFGCCGAFSLFLIALATPFIRLFFVRNSILVVDLLFPLILSCFALSPLPFRPVPSPTTRAQAQSFAIIDSELLSLFFPT